MMGEPIGSHQATVRSRTRNLSNAHSVVGSDGSDDVCAGGAGGAGGV